MLIYIGFIRYKKRNQSFADFFWGHTLWFRIAVSVFLLWVLLWISAEIKRNDTNFSNTEAINFIIRGMVVIGIFYSVLTFEFNVKKSKDDRSSARDLTTFDILKSWYNTPIYEYVKTINGFEETEEFKLINTGFDDFMKIWADKSEDRRIIRRALNGILNYFEIISAGIAEGCIDEAFTKRYFEDVFYEYYDSWKPIIIEGRKKLPDMFCEFTTLVEKWRNGSSS